MVEWYGWPFGSGRRTLKRGIPSGEGREAGGARSVASRAGCRLAAPLLFWIGYLDVDPKTRMNQNVRHPGEQYTARRGSGCVRLIVGCYDGDVANEVRSCGIDSHRRAHACY